MIQTFPTVAFPVVSRGGEANWHTPASGEVTSPLAANWLFDPGSLTAKLKQHSQHFAVQLLGQYEADLLDDEQVWLGAPQRCVIREVILWCDDAPWVFARSVFPLQALAQQQLKLEQLGNRPLGEHLFKQPDLVRSEVEISSFTADSKVGRLHQQLGYPATELWGRRSRFTAAQQHVLVAEVFIGASPLAQEVNRG